MSTYEEAANLEVRRDVSTAVLEAMDVDQYLIDAVRNATPNAEPQVPAWLVQKLAARFKSHAWNWATQEQRDVWAMAASSVSELVDGEPKQLPVLNSLPVGRFDMATEDLESLAGGTVPEWLRYDADAALGQASTEPAPSEDLTPEQSRIWEEGFDEACKEHIRDLQRIRAEAITAPEHCVLNKGIAAAKRQMARP